MAYVIDSALQDEVTGAPVVTFYPAVNKKDIAIVAEEAPENIYAISIGVLDDTEHDGVSSSLSYVDLFTNLAADGYDPLRPIRGNKAKKNIGDKLWNILLRNVEKGTKGKIYAQTRKLAIELCNFVKDYIIGSVSVPSFKEEGGIGKSPLARETIYKRRSLLNKKPYLYAEGSSIDEPLYETGRLCRAIKWRVERVHVFNVNLRGVAASLREAKKKEARASLGIRSAREMRKVAPKHISKEAERIIKKTTIDARELERRRDEWERGWMTLMQHRQSGYRTANYDAAGVEATIKRYRETAKELGIVIEGFS